MGRRKPELTLLHGGVDDAALPQLQADFPGYQILQVRDRSRGLILVAARNPGTEDGPLVVMAEEADEMRRILNAFL